MKKPLLLPAAAALVFAASSAQASEVFAGLLVHDVKTGITVSGIEDGVDFQLGFRGERLGGSASPWTPSPYVFASVNSVGDTNYAAAGLSWKFGDKVYFRPGVGVAIHDGPSQVTPGDDRIDFGSRILFAPEVALGVQISEQVSAEAAWVHLSHAQLFGGNNPGIDNIGVRLNYRFR